MGLSIEQTHQYVVSCVENHLHLLSEDELSQISFLIHVEQQERLHNLQYQKEAIADYHTLKEDRE